MRKQIVAILIIAVLLTMGCVNNNPQPEPEPDKSGVSILNQALAVVELLKEQDMAGLANYVHPTAGVRFSPYGYVDAANYLVFQATDLTNILASTQIYHFGSYDGTGDPIDLSFSDYYGEFIYDVDYLNPHVIGNNHRVGHGNSLNNIQEVYPTGVYVEFHFTGFDPQYEGMDWTSLKLIFEEVDSTWMLVGIVHDQWTI